jgi:hypothetical protein
MHPKTIKKHLKQLRRECIDNEKADLILQRIAYEMEQAVRRVTESGLVGWPSLSQQAREGAALLRKELS